MHACLLPRPGWGIRRVVHLFFSVMTGLIVTVSGALADAPTGGVGAVGAVAAASPVSPTAFDASRSDPKAIAVADRMMSALGGTDAWAGTRYLYFTFAVGKGSEELTRRTHIWDRATGRHRIQGIDREKRPYVIIHTLGDTTNVTAVMGGEPVTDPEKMHRIKEHAYALWVNDTYWLLMPYKLKDPGVMLAYEGEKSEGDRTWDVVRLSFDRVGLTPGDRYWAYINRETGLLDRWAFVLESMDAKDEPAAFDWKGWRRFGRIMLSDSKVAVGEDQRIFFPDLAVFDQLPETVFTSTAPPTLPGM